MSVCPTSPAQVELEVDYNLRRQVLWVWINDDRRARSWGSSNSNVLKVGVQQATSHLNVHLLVRNLSERAFPVSANLVMAFASHNTQR